MLSHVGAMLANGGVVPGGSIRILSSETARLLRTLMSTCGLYDHTGQFAWQVGLPAKSGSAGGIMAAVPGKMGIGTFSPLLDSAGNSVCGIKMLEHLSRELSLYVY
jgi:glutaminase